MSEAVPLFEPGEALELAHAIAFRSGQLTLVSSQIAARLQGHEYKEPSPEELQETHLGRTVLYLAQVQDPDRPFEWPQYLAVGNQQVEQSAGRPVDAATDRTSDDALSLSLFDEYREASGETEERLGRDFKNILMAARAVAAERQVPIASVYTEDEYYYEARRRISTPERMAHTICRQVEGMSPEVMTRFLLKNLATIAADDELDATKLDELALAIQLDPITQNAIANSTDTFQEVVRQRGVYMFSRIFGADALADLPEAQRQIIMPRHPLTVDVFNKGGQLS